MLERASVPDNYELLMDDCSNVVSWDVLLAGPNYLFVFRCFPVSGCCCMHAYY